MVGNGKAQLLISPQEAITIARKYGTVDTIDIALELYKEWNSQTSTDIWTGHRDFSFMCMLSTIFDAGRIQGIREERQHKQIRGASVCQKQ